MAFSITAFAKKVPVPFVYGVCGWIITEVPVLLTVIPATLDGYSTAEIVAGLTFIGSAAYWLHQELQPYITGPSTTSTSTASTSASSTSSTVTAAPTTATATTVPAVSYQYQGQTITVATESPIGQNDVISGATYTIGTQISTAVTINGTAVPAGAVYLGQGTFELNGNYFDVS